MRVIKRWFPAAFICIAVFLISSDATPMVANSHEATFISNKVAHLIIYSALTLAFYRATKNVLLSMLLAVLYGITDEMHQQFVPARSGMIRDVGIDAVAATFAGIILWKYYQNLPKILRNWLEA